MGQIAFHNILLVFWDDCANRIGFLEELDTLLVSVLAERPSATNQEIHVLPDPSFQLLVSEDYACRKSPVIFLKNGKNASAEREKTEQFLSI
jgi:hypothetical protein